MGPASHFSVRIVGLIDSCFRRLSAGLVARSGVFGVGVPLEGEKALAKPERYDIAASAVYATDSFGRLAKRSDYVVDSSSNGVREWLASVGTGRKGGRTRKKMQSCGDYMVNVGGDWSRPAAFVG